MPQRCLFLTLVCGLTLTFWLSAADEGIDAVRIDKLIAQLGSNNFAAREDAFRQLDQTGQAALEALKKAAKSSDVETRRRAEELVGRIEKRSESTRLLTPTRVTLRFKDTAVKDAIDELVRQSGQPIELRAAAAAANRRVTLEVAEKPFWEALDQFCRAAGLVEMSSVPVAMQVPSKPGKAPIRPPTERVLTPGQIGDHVFLADGAPPTCPTQFAGAARIRAMPAGAHRGDLVFALDLGLEAKRPLLRVMGVRIDKAIDDSAQSLEGEMAVPSTGADAPVFIGNVQGKPTAHVGTAGHHRVLVKLKAKDQPSRTLKEVAGQVTVAIWTPPVPLLTVDDILKAGGKTAKGDAGGSLTVHEVARQDDGQVRVRVALELPPEGNGPNAPMPAINAQLLAAGKAFLLAGGSNVNVWDDGKGHGVALLDAKGEKLPLADTKDMTWTINNSVVTHEVTLFFKPKAGQAEPARLVYSGSQPATVEIPFTLRDVPLP